jgi:hypothetical protein
VRRNADERALSGFKGGRRLEALLPRMPGESYHKQARRYVRTSYQIADIRRRNEKNGRTPPPGFVNEAPVEPTPGAGTL